MRNEEGGCRPLFQGIYNVIKAQEQTDMEQCPICGSRDVIVAKNEGDRVYVWGIKCNNCDTEYKLNVATMKDAVKKWNGRKGVPRRCCGNCKHYSEDMCLREFVRDPFHYGNDVCDNWEVGE